MKIVINGGYGGFGISWDTFFYLAERNHPFVEDMFEKWAEPGVEEFYIDDPERDDPMLIFAIEELGSDIASDDYAELKVVSIPDGVDWVIEEYDGWETIAEKHRTWG